MQGWKADLNPGADNIFPVTNGSVSKNLPKGPGYYMFTAIGCSVNISTEATVSFPASASPDVGMLIQSGVWSPPLFIDSNSIKIISTSATGNLVCLPVTPHR